MDLLSKLQCATQLLGHKRIPPAPDQGRIKELRQKQAVKRKAQLFCAFITHAYFRSLRFLGDRQIECGLQQEIDLIFGGEALLLEIGLPYGTPAPRFKEMRQYRK